MASDEKTEYDDLKERTEEYHELWRNINGEQKAWKLYLQDSKLKGGTGSRPPLLQLEMEYAQKNGRLPSPRPNTTLVILLGETFEPLLQSIWAHEPTCLIPIVNTYYGDVDDKNSSRDTWASFYYLLQSLPDKKKKRIENLAELKTVEPVQDDPTSVFERLREKLQRDIGTANRHVVIDITGAKKTMVAGAFMYAAYTQTTINYVDTEKRSKDHKQPLGFTCHFRQIKSPLDELMLHIWQQIEDRYTRYDFAGALQLLNHAIPQTALGESSLKNLQTFLQICHEWDNGQLQQAFDKLTDLPDDLKQLVPTAVSTLGPYWPKENEIALNPLFFCHPEAIEIFARDELARVRRLTIPHTQKTPVVTQLAYKAAFARAYALYETSLKARIAVLHCIQKECNQATLQELLSKIKQNTGQIQKELVQAQPVHLLPELDVYNKTQLNLKTLKEARNSATHNYFPIQPDLARQVITLAEKSLENYLAEWKPLMTDVIRQQYGIEPMDVTSLNLERSEWRELRTRCQLYFIPEKNKEAT